MDWLIFGAIAVACWAMLSVLSGERLNRSQQIAAAIAEKTQAAVEVPIVVGSPVKSAISAAAMQGLRK